MPAFFVHKTGRKCTSEVSVTHGDLLSSVAVGGKGLVCLGKYTFLNSFLSCSLSSKPWNSALSLSQCNSLPKSFNLAFQNYLFLLLPVVVPLDWIFGLHFQAFVVVSRLFCGCLCSGLLESLFQIYSVSVSFLFSFFLPYLFLFCSLMFDLKLFLLVMSCPRESVVVEFAS